MAVRARVTSSHTPLTAAEQRHVAALLAARTRIAWGFTVLSALATAAFALKRLAGLVAAERSTLGLVAGLAAVVAALVWWFGWRLVFALRDDLRDGHKHTLQGTITALDSQPNAYGETITHVTIEGVRVVGRAPELATWRVGQRATVEVLPRSRVAFGGSLS